MESFLRKHNKNIKAKQHSNINKHKYENVIKIFKSMTHNEIAFGKATRRNLV